MARAFGSDPFQFVAAVMLSARSRDSVTIPTAQKLFNLAPTPQAVLALDRNVIEQILRPIGFYRVKTTYLLGLAARVTDGVPRTFIGLTALPGVSRKVANVVLGELFHQDVVAVDTHVHRISNRLGWVHTTKPEETEQHLMKLLPQNTWRIINPLFVQHGQTLCLPLHPKCRSCPIAPYCPKIGAVDRRSGVQ